jgi:hypothetical protein
VGGRNAMRVHNEPQIAAARNSQETAIPER